MKSTKASPENLNTKELKIKKVSEVVFSILVNSGITGLTHAQVARLSGISRSWLYKYIGSDKKDLMKFAIQCLGEQLTTQDVQDRIETKEDYIQSILRGMERMFENTTKYPFFIPLYYRFKGTSTAPGEAVAKVENIYIERQSKILKKVFQISLAEARLSAIIMTSFRMSIAHTWQFGVLKGQVAKEDLLGVLQIYLEELFEGKNKIRPKSLQL